MISTWVKLKIAMWLRLGMIDQVTQWILRRRLYLEGPYCMWNDKQKALYRDYLDQLEKKVAETIKRKVL